MTTTDVPAHVPPALAFPVDIDDIGDDPLTVFDKVRASGLRVAWIPPSSGCSDWGWLLLHAADIRAALQQPDVFSSVPAEADFASKIVEDMRPIFADPPELGRFRRLLLPLFAPNVVATYEARLRPFAAALIDAFVPDGRCEFVAQFARPLPTRMFVELFGLPVEETERFVALGQRLMHNASVEDRMEAFATVGTIIRTVIAERAEAPRDDLISHIVNGSLDGEDVTPDEAYGMGSLLYTAGLDTVTSALSFSLRYLAQHPNDQQRLAEDPAITETAVEELLRRHAFVNNTRRVTREIDFAGVRMMPGDRVLCSHLIASRDPDEFEDPDVVDFDRSVQGNFAFGAGPHRCLGSHLARLELKIALEEWHQRIPRYELVPGAPVRAHGGFVMGMSELHLQW